MTNKSSLLALRYKDEDSDIGFLARSFLDACAVLKEINRFNRINNDLEAYLHDLAEWAIEGDGERPNPESFGLKE